MAVLNRLLIDELKADIKKQASHGLLEINAVEFHEPYHYWRASLRAVQAAIFVGRGATEVQALRNLEKKVNNGL